MAKIDRCDPLFNFFGSKTRKIGRYTAPHPGQHIIEPFAGSASFARRYYRNPVTLIEKDPVIAELWRWLIKSNAQDVLDLPLMGDDPTQTVQDLGLDPGPSALIGFWIKAAQAVPGIRRNGWGTTVGDVVGFWGPRCRQRVADNIHKVNHWTIQESGYHEAPMDPTAHYFIDPPYQDAGKAYKYGANLLDFEALGNWCREIPGHVTVCENAGARWLPFITLAGGTNQNSQRRTNTSCRVEVVWNRGPTKNNDGQDWSKPS